MYVKKVFSPFDKDVVCLLVVGVVLVEGSSDSRRIPYIYDNDEELVRAPCLSFVLSLLLPLQLSIQWTSSAGNSLWNFANNIGIVIILPPIQSFITLLM